jgi:hypothetical protein
VWGWARHATKHPWLREGCACGGRGGGGLARDTAPYLLCPHKHVHTNGGGVGNQAGSPSKVRHVKDLHSGREGTCVRQPPPPNTPHTTHNHHTTRTCEEGATSNGHAGIPGAYTTSPRSHAPSSQRRARTGWKSGEGVGGGGGGGKGKPRDPDAAHLVERQLAIGGNVRFLGAKVQAGKHAVLSRGV